MITVRIQFTLMHYKNINNIFGLIYLLKFKLATKGVIIIENFYFNLPLISKIFFFFETNILDFRLNKFIINNCLIEVKNGSRFRNLIKTFTRFHKYIYHIFDTYSSYTIITPYVPYFHIYIISTISI